MKIYFYITCFSKVGSINQKSKEVLNFSVEIKLFRLKKKNICLGFNSKNFKIRFRGAQLANRREDITKNYVNIRLVYET